MTFFSLLLLAISLSMDAFAVSISQGIALKKVHFCYALRNGIIFGVIEGITPLVGWGLGYLTSGLLVAWSHWLAFTLLLLLGSRMLYAGLRCGVSQPVSDHHTSQPVAHSIGFLLLTAIATSIDALAIGIGLAFLHVNMLWAALVIGCVSAIMSTTGIIFGRYLGTLSGRWAEIIGGLVLAGMGCQILISHFYQ